MMFLESSSKDFFSEMESRSAEGRATGVVFRNLLSYSNFSCLSTSWASMLSEGTSLLFLSYLLPLISLLDFSTGVLRSSLLPFISRLLRRRLTRECLSAVFSVKRTSVFSVKRTSLFSLEGI